MYHLNSLSLPAASSDFLDFFIFISITTLLNFLSLSFARPVRVLAKVQHSLARRRQLEANADATMPAALPLGTRPILIWRVLIFVLAPAQHSPARRPRFGGEVDDITSHGYVR